MRLFVAGDLPPEPRAALAAHGRALVASGGWRAVAEPSLHLTLAFLGERPEEDVARIAAALPDAATPCGPVSLGASILLPRRSPRGAAVELHDPGEDLARLQASVSAALAGLDVYRPEARRYLP